jgi:hypothetical protein
LEAGSICAASIAATTFAAASAMSSTVSHTRHDHSGVTIGFYGFPFAASREAFDRVSNIGTIDIIMPSLASDDIICRPASNEI